MSLFDKVCIKDLIKEDKGITKNSIILIVILVIVVISVSVFIVYQLSNYKENDIVNETNVVEENILTNQEVTEEQAVAKIQDKFYTTIQDAINEVEENTSETTIEVLKDVSENLTIDENKNIKIILNNHTINNLNREETTITVKGALIINDGNISGQYVTRVATINVMQNAKLDLANVSIDRTSNDENAHETIETHGILTIDSSKVTSSNSDAIYVYGDKNTQLNIKGNSEITANNNPSIYNRSNGRITIEGGTITSKTSDAMNNQIDGIINISGGKITSETGRAINNYGNIEITGVAEITSTGSPTIYNQSEGVLKITGGTIEATSGNSIGIMNQNNSNLTIAGGTVKSDKGNAIYNIGTLTISDSANIISNGEQAPTIYNNTEGTITVTGGTITNTSTNYDIYNNDGSVNAEENLINKKNWE